MEFRSQFWQNYLKRTFLITKEATLTLQYLFTFAYDFNAYSSQQNKMFCCISFVDFGDWLLLNNFSLKYIHFNVLAWIFAFFISFSLYLYGVSSDLSKARKILMNKKSTYKKSTYFHSNYFPTLFNFKITMTFISVWIYSKIFNLFSLFDFQRFRLSKTTILTLWS